jgi:carbonic anhydrase/acetyltransferase-like protein (isoleucine patch superfamily)
MSLEVNIAGDMPHLDASACLDPSATLVGNVRVGPKVYVGAHAVIRADEPGPDGVVAPIAIGAEANVQDGDITHALAGTGVTIGPRASIAHGAVVHGPCAIGEGGFVGFNAIIFNAALGARVVVMHGALVEGVSIPDGLYVPSMTAIRSRRDVERLQPTSPESLVFVARVSAMNVRLAEGRVKRLSRDLHRNERQRGRRHA